MLRRRFVVAASIVVLTADCKPRVGGTCTMGQAACTDERSGLFCGTGGAYRAISCRGRDGCQQSGAKVSCDQSAAAAGDACTRPGYACSADMKHALSCQAGKFVLAQTCSGPFACRVAPFDGFAPGGSGNVLCDNDIATAGDPCLDDGDFACEADETQALECVGKRMVALGTCDGPRRCSVVHPKTKDSELECDMLDDSVY
jgi:hypothetical protein